MSECADCLQWQRLIAEELLEKVALRKQLKEVMDVSHQKLTSLQAELDAAKKAV